MTPLRRDIAGKMTNLLMEIAERTGHTLDPTAVRVRLDEVLLGDDQEQIDEFLDVVLDDLRVMADRAGNREILALLSDFDAERNKAAHVQRRA